MGFSLVLLLNKRKELVFTDNVMCILWLDNSCTGDKLVSSEACRDDRNSQYITVGRARINEPVINYVAGFKSVI